MGSRENIEAGELSSPLLDVAGGRNRGADDGGGSSTSKQSGGGSENSSSTVVLSTLVAVSGSYVFGSAVGFSSPARSGIMYDLGLSVAEYSVFGSILTIGAMIGAVVSGRMADYIGRRGTMGLSQIFCIFGWLAKALSKLLHTIQDITMTGKEEHKGYWKGNLPQVIRIVLCSAVQRAFRS